MNLYNRILYITTRVSPIELLHIYRSDHITTWYEEFFCWIDQFPFLSQDIEKDARVISRDFLLVLWSDASWKMLKVLYKIWSLVTIILISISHHQTSPSLGCSKGTKSDIEKRRTSKKKKLEGWRSVYWYVTPLLVYVWIVKSRLIIIENKN